jgi:PTS system ascorbate-specific IIA component
MLLRALCYRQGPLADTADKALAGGTQGVVRVAASVPQTQMQRSGTTHDPARLHDQQ